MFEMIGPLCKKQSESHQNIYHPFIDNWGIFVGRSTKNSLIELGKIVFGMESINQETKRRTMLRVLQQDSISWAT
jgi:hypothetical protein